MRVHEVQGRGKHPCARGATYAGRGGDHRSAPLRGLQLFALDQGKSPCGCCAPRTLAHLRMLGGIGPIEVSRRSYRCRTPRSARLSVPKSTL
jgi:hypothetical protein